jgi:hypothetical protein
MEVEANKMWFELSDIVCDIRNKDYDLALSKLNDLMCQFDEEEDAEEEDEEGE